MKATWIAVLPLITPFKPLKWLRPLRPLAGLAPDSLESREGCTVFLQRQADGSFAGATRAEDCASNLRGVAYATSEVVVTADGLTSWDRGYDAEGGQVWGSEHGPYVFRRIP